MSSLTGQTFAGYEILAKLGQGGMGAVYKARQPMLNRFVALKVMASNLSGDPSFVARFIREASAAANLNHPNMVQVYTAGESDKVYYIAMEFVEGESLRIRLDRLGRIPPQEAIAVTVYIAQALQYAWNKARLIHRDIKPDNIFLSNSGEVKVGDLGLAKSVGSETTELTQTGTAMGSPHYISPEQAQGAKDIDFRADIYSLGCTLYHMLTGKTPYSGDSSMAVIMKHVHDPPPAIFKVWPTCPMPLGMLVGRMLAKQRHERHQSYEDLIADLMQVHERLRQTESVAPVAATPAPVPDTVPKVKQTGAAVTTQAKLGNRKLVYAAAGVCAALALAGVLWWVPWKTQETEKAAAVSQVQPLQPAEPRQQEVVAPITSPAPSMPPPPSAQPAQPQPEAVTDSAWQNAINLLPLIEPQQDAVEGEWTIVNGELKSSGGKQARLQIPYQPPEEYDFRIAFSFPTGGFCLWQILTGAGRSFDFCIATKKGKWYGFQIIGGKNSDGGPSSVPMERDLEYGRCYTSLVQVRKDGVKAFLDGRFITEWKTDYRDMALPAVLRLRGERLLGIGSWQSSAVFHRIEVREVTGKGTFTRGVPAAGSAPATPQPAMPTTATGSQSPASPAPTPAAPASVATAQTDDGFQPLFNGRDLTGWSPREVAARKGSKLFYQPTTGGWMVQNGELVCASGSGGDLSRTAGKDPPTFFLKSNGEYGDFILQLEFKLCPNGHSGLYIRCSEAGNRNISLDGGMKIPILDPGYVGRMPKSSKYRTGAIGFVSAAGEAPLRATGQWNSMEIRCEGDNVEVTVNGTRTATANMSQEPKLRNCPRSGYIAIANWCCEADGMTFRNIRIKELGAASASPVPAPPPSSSVATGQTTDGFQPLFNGRDLTGWEGRPEFWSVQDGAIYGKTTVETPARQNTFLVCKAGEFDDFELRAQFKFASGDEGNLANSGIQYRSKILDAEYFVVAGYQADMGRLGGKNLDGSLYEERGRGVLIECGQKAVIREGASPKKPQVEITGSTASAADIAAASKRDDWNDMVIIARGNHLQHFLNGMPMLDVTDETAAAARTGIIALQIKSGPPMQVWFRNLRIKKLAPDGQPTGASRQDSISSSSALKLLGNVYANAVGAEMVYIPPGEFMLGSTPQERAWATQPENGGEDLARLKREGEQPRRTTIRQGFWMGRTEVTVGQWKRFVDATNYQTVAERLGEVSVSDPSTRKSQKVKGLSWRNPGFSIRDDYPVSCIQWDDAVAFCDWLNQKEQAAQRLPTGCKIRLATEAEWEYACRGGRQGAAFWWGDSKEDGKGRLNWRGDEEGVAHASPVDSFGVRGRNGFGLADMLGNVNEYCIDEYDPQGAHEEPYRGNPGQHVSRGGAFVSSPATARCATRNFGAPRMVFNNNGFRVCLGVDVSSEPTGAAAASPPIAPANDGAFIQEVAALPAEQQVARVVTKLKELNPSFDGKETHKVEGGAVTELAFSTVGVTDIAPVKALKWLKKLTIAPWAMNQKGSLSDLLALKELPLSWLYCQNNPLSDLSPLKGLPLTVLGCGGTQVSDLSPLAGMKLTVLSVNDTAVSDLSPLSGMPLTVLWCNNTKITDFAPLKGLPLQELRCDFQPQRDAEVLRGIPTLQKINDQTARMFWARVPAGGAGPTAASAAGLRSLSPGGFQTLFNGRDLTGWKPIRTTGADDEEHRPSAGGWIVRNGELVCVTDQSGWLKSERQYGNFVLQLEFRLRSDGNSGVYIRSPDSGHLSRAGIEIQIIDPNYKGRAARFTGDKLTGAIYSVAGMSHPPERPIGEWNSMSIRCEGDNIEVTLNGTRTAAANMGQETALRNRQRSGYIGLSNWHGEAKGVAFRNIQIKELPGRPAGR